MPEAESRRLSDVIESAAMFAACLHSEMDGPEPEQVNDLMCLVMSEQSHDDDTIVAHRCFLRRFAELLLSCGRLRIETILLLMAAALSRPLRAGIPSESVPRCGSL